MVLNCWEYSNHVLEFPQIWVSKAVEKKNPAIVTADEMIKRNLSSICVHTKYM